MHHVDILTAFIISGAGSAVAAVMTALPRPAERHVADALRLSSAAFAVFGVGMLQLVFGVDRPDSPAIVFALTCTTLTVALFGWGLARLGRQRVPPAPALALLAAIVLAFGAAHAAGGWAVSHTFVALSTSISLLAVAANRDFLLRPDGLAERVLGWAIAAFAASWLLRAALTLSYTGPPRVHHLNVPEAAMPLFAMFYGVMPIFLATVVLGVINERLSRQLERRALTDELTGLMSRRALHELAAATIAHARRNRDEVAVLMLDIDHFKNVNDRHGHAVGDDVLRQIAALLRSQLRADALLTRHGGEEFAAVVPVAGVAVARQVAERLRFAIAEVPCRSGPLALQITASIGLTILRRDETLDDALRRADEALYRAKREGRDRVQASLDVAA
jgi:diguanylate cyclase (GGDEF)-like protein